MNRLERVLAEMSSLKGIKLQFVIPTLMTTLIVSVALGAITLATTISGINEEMEIRGRAMSNVLAKIAPTYLSNSDLKAMQGFVEEVAGSPEVAYASFSKPDGETIVETNRPGNLSRFKVFETPIVSGAGTVLARFKVAYSRDVLRNKVLWSVFWEIAGVALSLTLIGTRVYRIASRISEVLSDVSNQVLVSVSEIRKTGEEINALSRRLTEVSSEAETSMHNTVSNIDQMTTVISQTTKNADVGMAKARESQIEASDGKEVIARFEQAMAEINRSNRKLGTIRDVVSQLEAKTQIIYEIVFQIKVLSFNASIEAARAGSQGKGFAVVAEEVGKLAKLSGAAADEIQQLLHESHERVETTIQETASKAEVGQKASAVCSEVFNKIALNVGQLDKMMASFSDAAREQEQGIKSTATAMTNLSEVTNRNSHLAQKALEFAEFLQSQSESLQKNLTVLDEIIGEKDRDAA